MNTRCFDCRQDVFQVLQIDGDPHSLFTLAGLTTTRGCFSRNSATLSSLE